MVVFLLVNLCVCSMLVGFLTQDDSYKVDDEDDDGLIMQNPAAVDSSSAETFWFYYMI